MDSCKPGGWCASRKVSACGCDTWDLWIHGPGRETRYIFDGFLCEDHRVLA